MISRETQRQIDLYLRVVKYLQDGTAEKAEANAKIHASSRGFPTGTLGDGTSRSTDSTSSTERAAMPRHPDPSLFHYSRMRERRLLGERVLADYANLVAEWTPDAREELAKGPLARYCANSANGCDTILVPGNIRNGRCERCSRYLRRTGRDWNTRAVESEDQAAS